VSAKARAPGRNGDPRPSSVQGQTGSRLHEIVLIHYDPALPIYLGGIHSKGVPGVGVK
jgi:hypothetical protein